MRPTPHPIMATSLVYLRSCSTAATSRQLGYRTGRPGNPKIRAGTARQGPLRLRPLHALRFHPLPEVRHRAARVPAVHDHPRLHDHQPAGGVSPAGHAHHDPAVRAGRVGLRVQRGSVGSAGRGLRRQVRPQAAAALLLLRVSARHVALRGGHSYRFLLGARIVTGMFGGVIGSISMAIIADLFPLEVRGRVMGTIQTAFAASQVMGLPLGVLPAEPLGLARPLHHDPGGGGAGRPGRSRRACNRSSSI